MQKEHRLSFCINLEVVILEVEIQRSFFGRIQDSIICFRDCLTFSTPATYTAVEILDCACLAPLHFHFHRYDSKVTVPIRQKILWILKTYLVTEQ